MTASVTPIGTNAEIDHSWCIESLEEAIALAKQHGVTSFSVVMAGNGLIIRNFHCRNDVFTMLGALQVQQAEIVDAHIER